MVQHPLLVGPTYKVWQIRAAKNRHIDHREDVRKQLRRGRIVLWYKENADWNMPEHAIGPTSEVLAITRIDKAEKALEFVAFAEDADDVRAVREAEIPWMPRSRPGWPGGEA